MAQMTDYLETKLSDFLLDLNSGVFTAPGTLYLALFTVDPGESGTLTNEVDNAGTAYAREEISFGVAADGVSTTDLDVTFTQATATWNTVTHFGIMDAVTYQAGNMLFHSALNTPKTIDTDDIFKVTAGNITVTLA